MLAVWVNNGRRLFSTLSRQGNQPWAAEQALDFRTLPTPRLTIDGEKASVHDVEDGCKLRALGEVCVVRREDVPDVRRVASEEHVPIGKMYPEVGARFGEAHSKIVMQVMEVGNECRQHVHY